MILPIIASTPAVASIAAMYVGRHPDVTCAPWDGEGALPACERGGVYVVRDPRGTFVSARGDGHDPQQAVTRAMILERRINEHENRERISIVSVELLCTNPGEVTGALWKALGLPPMGTDAPLPSVKLPTWAGEIAAPEHNEIVTGCASFLKRYNYPRDPMPMIGDMLLAFMNGADLSTVEGGQDLLRKQLVAFTRVSEGVRRDLMWLMKGFADEIQRLETEPHTTEWERWHARGEIAGYIRANDAAGVVANRHLSEMMR